MSNCSETAASLQPQAKTKEKKASGKAGWDQLPITKGIFASVTNIFLAFDLFPQFASVISFFSSILL